MTDTYQVADGFNNSGNLADIAPQPQCDGVFHAEKITGLTGISHNEGTKRFKWVYSPSITRTDLATVLSALGVSPDTDANEVTVKTRKGSTSDTFQTYNATVHYPDLEGKGRLGNFRSVEIDFTDADEI